MPQKNVPVEASLGRGGEAQPAKTKLRYAWHEFFKRFDVLLTPVVSTQPQPQSRRTHGQRQRQIGAVRRAAVLAGLASLSYLPATAAPIGLTAEGLPVGLQIIGPEGEDPTTIAFARLLATEIGGFVPPPAYT